MATARKPSTTGEIRNSDLGRRSRSGVRLLVAEWNDQPVGFVAATVGSGVAVSLLTDFEDLSYRALEALVGQLIAWSPAPRTVPAS